MPGMRALSCEYDLRQLSEAVAVNEKMGEDYLAMFFVLALPMHTS
jgi:hypothetical protein